MYGRLVYIILVILLLSGCTKPHQVIQQVTAKEHEHAGDENIKLIAELPVKIDSSDYLVFPVTALNSGKRTSKVSYTITKYYENYYENFIFQNTKNGETHFITEKPVKIISYQQLKNENNNPDKVLIYEVIDNLRPNDPERPEITSLYLSSIDGKTFTRVSKEKHDVRNWVYIPQLKKVFFNTVVDKNNDNQFDEKDEYSTYQVSIETFKPIKILEDEMVILNQRITNY